MNHVPYIVLGICIIALLVALFSTMDKQVDRLDTKVTDLEIKAARLEVDKDWRKNYIGAVVNIGGRPATVTDSVLNGAYAAVTFSDGKRIDVDWLVVTNQVNAACARKP